MIRIVIIDDQRLVREGLAELLSAHVDVAGLAANGVEGIEVCRAQRPDVALVDVVMPEMDGPSCARRILAEGLSTRVLALTTYDTDENALAMLTAGASGYVLKDIEPLDLVAAIRFVHEGETTIAPSALRRLVDRLGHVGSMLPSGPRALTERELQVLRLVARGQSNSELAKELHLSESTVKTYVGRLLDKLECRDRSQLVVVAYETGIIRPGDG
jgi:DNA-binding NarL/FixJ family response regulator